MPASHYCPACRTPLPEVPASGICPRCGTPWDTPARLPTDDTRTFSPAAAVTPPHPGAATLPQVHGNGRTPHIPNYRNLTYLTSGGMGSVFRAVQCGTERPVALKVINGMSAYDPAARLRFGHEMQALGRVKHPSVVQVYDTGTADDTPFYSMEYVGGGTLADLLKRRGADLPLDEVARIMAAVAEGVHAAHQEQVLHRDIKPGNILLTEDGTPKVADFGLAKLTDSDLQLTVTGSLMGTPPYMAPEQVRGVVKDITERSDVYGLGATLYECLTGRPPFRGESREMTQQMVLHSEPNPPSQLRPEIPKDLEAVCLKCLAKDPAKRFSTAQELADELRRWRAGEPTRTQPPTRLQQVGRWARRHRVTLALAGIVLLAVVGTLAGMWYYDPKRQIERDLAAGREVTLIGPTGDPRWFEWEMGRVELTGSVQEDGTCGFQTHTTSVLTLLGNPMNDSYRVSVELRHLQSHADDAMVGVFVGLHTVPARPDLRTSRFLGFDYSDFWRVAELKDPQLLARNHGLDARDCVTVKDGKATSPPGWHDYGVKPFTPTHGPNGWRKIVVDVSPAGVTAYWDPPDENAPPAFQLTARQIEASFAQHNENQANRWPGFAMPPIAWNPRGGVGIYARASAVAVRNVSVRPLKPGAP